MLEELNEVLQKNLPAQVAGEMRKALDDYEKVKKELEQCCKTNRRLEDELNISKAENIRLSKLEQQYTLGIQSNKLDAESIESEKRDLKVKKLEFQLESERKIVSSQHELMSIAFKHVRPVTVTHQNETTHHSTMYNNSKHEEEIVESGKLIDTRTEVIDE